MTPRPTINDPDIIRAAAEMLYPRVRKWLEELGDKVEDEPAIMALLCEAMRWADDGYKMARALDDWDPDAALVDILDSAGQYKRVAIDQACIEWLKTSGLVAPEIGSWVTCAKHHKLGFGRVVRSTPDGCSTVAFTNQRPSVIGYICPWEELTPV